jgi:PhoPQ-activated pathogenicity-related protein
MPSPLLRICLLFFCLAAPMAAVAKDPNAKGRTALDEYVEKVDPSYEWKLVETSKKPGVTNYAIDLTSQTWRPEDTDRPQWKHRLIIVKPDDVQSDTAFLFISGGGNDREFSNNPDVLSMMIARESKTIIAELKQIPNQPMTFLKDGKPRKEDDLIGYTWDKVITTGDPTWSARLPMVKAAVRAMDTVQAMLASDEGGKFTVNKFVVAGGSKRGWTTWLTGAVDKRVVAIIPAVIDVLNMKESMQHHYAAYGFWAEAVGDYVQHKVMEKQNHPGYKLLIQFEDPINYVDRLTMPKFVVNAAGDQFFLPDSSQFYWDKLKGEKYLRYVANGEHSLAGTDAPMSIAAFYMSVVQGTPRPKLDWTFESDGAIRVVTPDKPKKVLLWQATNPDARDFRVTTIGRAYKSSPLEDQGDGVFVGNVQPPEKGFTAYFVELEFESGFKFPFKFTTGVRVVPDVLPHQDKLQELLSAGK